MDNQIKSHRCSGLCRRATPSSSPHSTLENRALNVTVPPCKCRAPAGKLTMPFISFSFPFFPPLLRNY